MCVPSGRGVFIRKRGSPAQRVTQGSGDRTDMSQASPAQDLTSSVSTPTADGGSAPSSGGGSRTMRFNPPGSDPNLQYGPIGGDVQPAGANRVNGPSAPIAPRPGGDVVTAGGRTRKKAGDILRSGILSTVRSAGASGALASLFAPSAAAGGAKDKLGQ